MFQMIIIAMFALMFTDKAEAQSAADVEREAQAAFAELDPEIAELEDQQQAEFRLLVRKELTALKLDLQSAYNDSFANKIVGLADGYVQELLADDAASPQIKTLQFADFINRVRTTTRLSVESNEDTVAVDEEYSSVGSTTVEGVDLLVEAAKYRYLAPSRLDLNNAYNEANWISNTVEGHVSKRWWKPSTWGKRYEHNRNIPKKWWGREGQVWVSADGKVTFAVAKGESRLVQLAHNKAEMEARLLLAGGRRPGVIMATLVGTQAIRWKHQKDGVYCLMAVPTVLLPKEVER